MFRPSHYSRMNTADAEAAATKEGTSPARQEFPVRASTVTLDRSRAQQWISLAGLVGFPVAMAVSYKRNQSIGWAVGAGLVWPAYLVYTLILDRK